MTTELIKQEILTPAIYDDNKIEQTLADIKDRASSFVSDISTKTGRKETASFAMKIAKCKTAIDGIGKDRVSDAKAAIKIIDNQRKLVRDTLDELKEQVRKPLTEYENAEKMRVERLNNGVNAIRDVGDKFLIEWGSFALEELQEQILILDDKDDGTWQEFNDAAVKAIKDSKEKIDQAITKRMAYDAEQAELEKLRKEAAERAQKERDGRIRKEAEEKAKQEAEIKAKREAEKVEAEKLRIIQEKEESERKAKEAEQRAQEAEVRAKREAEEAVTRERERVAAEGKAKAAAQAKLEANKKHTSKIHEQIAEALETLSVKYSSSEMVEKIASGDIPHLSINY